MMMRTVGFAVAVSLVNLAGAAHAAELISSPLWTDVGNAGTCYIRNVGTTAFRVNAKLFSNNGFTVNINTCNSGLLGPGKTCVLFSTDLPDDSDVACSVKTSDVNAKNLRGSIDVRNFAGHGATVVVREDLR